MIPLLALTTLAAAVSADPQKTEAQRFEDTLRRAWLLNNPSLAWNDVTNHTELERYAWWYANVLAKAFKTEKLVPGQGLRFFTKVLEGPEYSPELMGRESHRRPYDIFLDACTAAWTASLNDRLKWMFGFECEDPIRNLDELKQALYVTERIGLGFWTVSEHEVGKRNGRFFPCRTAYREEHREILNIVTSYIEWSARDVLNEMSAIHILNLPSFGGKVPVLPPPGKPEPNAAIERRGGEVVFPSMLMEWDLNRIQILSWDETRLLLMTRKKAFSNEWQSSGFYIVPRNDPNPEEVQKVIREKFKASLYDDLI
jgi:hypothetical protein